MNEHEPQLEGSQSLERLEWIVVMNDMQENFKEELGKTTFKDYLEFLQDPFGDDRDDNPEKTKSFKESSLKTLQSYIDRGLINEQMTLREVIDTIDPKID